MTDGAAASSRKRLQGAPDAPRRRLLRALAVALACLAVLTAAVVVGAPLVIERAVRDGAASLSRATGRRVTLGRVDVRVGARVRVDIRDLDVAARAGATRRTPALHVRAIHAVVRWWPFVRSRGRSLAVESITVDSPAVEVARSADGSLSVDDVAARLRAPTRTSPPHGAPRVHIDRVDVRDARVTLVEVGPEGATHAVSLSRTRASARDVSPGAPIRVAVDGALLADAPNARLVAELVPAPTRQTPDALRLRSLSLSLHRVVLDPALALDAAHAAPIERARLDGTARIDLPTAGGAVDLRADLRADEVVMRQGRAPGDASSRRFDASLTLDSAIDRAQGRYDLRRVALSVDGMGFEGRADLRSTDGRPVVHALELRSTGVRLERVVALLPERMRPPPAALEGPVEITASAVGSHDDAHLDARVDLASATVALPDLRKPAGAPLSIELHGHATPGRVDVERLGVVLGPLRLLSHGVVRWPESLDLSFDSGQVALEDLLPFVPSAQRGIAGRASFRGEARVVGEVRRASDGDHARVSLALRAAAVHTAALALQGDVDVRAEAGMHRGRLALRGDLDATRAHLGTPGGVDKPAGVPLRAHVELHRTGRRVRVESAWLEAPGVKLSGSLDADLATGRLTARTPECDLDVARLGALLPDITRRLPRPLSAARARFALTFEGDPRALRDAEAHVTNLALHAPFGTLRGRFDVFGLESPRRVDLDVDLDALDLGAIVPEETTPQRSRARPTWLDAIEVDARVRGREVRFRENVFSNVDAHVTLSRGHLDAPTLRFRLADGSVDLTGTRLRLDGARELTLHARVDRLDLARLGADPTPRAQGRLTLDADLTGPTEGEHPERSLTGSLHATATDLRVQRVATPTITFSNPLLARLAARAPRGGDSGEARAPVGMRRLEARFRLDRGVLQTVTPLAADSELGAIELSGSIALGGAIDLRGSLQIPPESIRAQTHGRLLPAGPVPVNVHVTGTGGEPRVEITDVSAMVRALAGSGLRAIGARLRERFGSP